MPPRHGSVGRAGLQSQVVFEEVEVDAEATEAETVELTVAKHVEKMAPQSAMIKRFDTLL